MGSMKLGYQARLSWGLKWAVRLRQAGLLARAWLELVWSLMQRRTPSTAADVDIHPIAFADTMTGHGPKDGI